MKSLSTKLFAIVFMFILAAGCASVTDAGLEEPVEEPQIEQVTPPTPDTGFGGDDVDPIRDKPIFD